MHEERERVWLEREVAFAAHLTDQERIEILADLLRTVDAIQRTKTQAQLEREEEVRRELEGEGLARYRALVERLEGA